MTAKIRMGVPRSPNETARQCGDKNVGSQSSEKAGGVALLERSFRLSRPVAANGLPGSERGADCAEKIGRLHLAEALSYRALAEDLRRAA
jgi:hypothetical protein